MKSALVKALFASSFVICGSHAFASDYKIDSRHTLVEFKVERLGFSHTIGWFRDVSGDVNFDPDMPESANVNVVIATESIDTNFPPRDEWLRSDEVLNAEKNPQITFVSKEIAVSGDNAGTLTGDLTMNGITKPVELSVTFNKLGMNPVDKVETVGFTATGSLKRSDYDVKAFLGPVGDDVTFEIQLEAALPKSE